MVDVDYVPSLLADIERGFQMSAAELDAAKLGAEAASYWDTGRFCPADGYFYVGSYRLRSQSMAYVVVENSFRDRIRILVPVPEEVARE